MLVPKRARELCFAKGGRDQDPVWFWKEPSLKCYVWVTASGDESGSHERVLIVKHSRFDDRDVPGDCRPFAVKHGDCHVLFTDDLDWEPSFPVVWDSHG